MREFSRFAAARGRAVLPRQHPERPRAAARYRDLAAPERGCCSAGASAPTDLDMHMAIGAAADSMFENRLRPFLTGTSPLVSGDEA